jgi:ABC-type lipoprotein export system ATPase subunit
MHESIYIEGISIENFRLFRKLDAKGFGRVNLITGTNNSGKTTLLEALFLCLGPRNPQLWLNVNSRRGLSRVSPKQSTAAYLFHRTETSEPVFLTIQSSSSLKYSLEIELIQPTFYDIIDTVGSQGSQADSGVMTTDELAEAVIVQLTFISNDDPPQITRAIIGGPDKLRFEGRRGPVFHDSVFLSDRTDESNLRSQANRYSDLDKEGSISIFDQLLQIIEPELKRTSLAIENDVTLIHGDVGFGLVPLSLLSSGTRRLTDVLLALAHSRYAVVLIDEIENSFHHSVLDKVWSALAQFVGDYQCQVFATTHSSECVSSALQVFKDSSLDFRLHRLDRQGDRSELFTFDVDQLAAALETGWEVR